jgi:hypothetical protein
VRLMATADYCTLGPWSLFVVLGPSLVLVNQEPVVNAGERRPGARR